MVPDVTDEHLVIQAQAGERDAFLTLYNRYMNKVFNRVRSRVPMQDAEDVTQEIFIAVVRSLDRFEGRSMFSTWLYTIVNRQIADYYRKFYRRSDHRTTDLENYEGLLFSAESERWDEAVMVQQALQKLPENYQEIILLRFADGLTFAEIADARSQSLEAAKSLFRRAIQALDDIVNRT
jgi:RNA polymerase sigma-70 factor (ECF subfamily)